MNEAAVEAERQAAERAASKRPGEARCEACGRVVSGPEPHIATVFVPLGKDRWMRNCRSCMHYGVKSRAAAPATAPSTSAGDGTPAHDAHVEERTEEGSTSSEGGAVAGHPASPAAARASDPTAASLSRSMPKRIAAQTAVTRPRPRRERKERPTMGEATASRQDRVRKLFEQGPQTKQKLVDATGWNEVIVGNALQALRRAGVVAAPAERGGEWTLAGGKDKRASVPPPSRAKRHAKRPRLAARSSSPRATYVPAKLSADAPLRDRLIAERAELVAQHEAQLAKFDQLIESL